MHLEFMGAPEDADDKTLAARRRLAGDRPAPAPAPAPAPPEPGPFVPKQRVHTYVVKGGDTLFQIATRLHVPGGWTALYQENLAVIGENPDLLFPGQLLTLP
jgi:nucleoid-associated protein YgaU